MSESFVIHFRIMIKNVAVLAVVYLMLCLSFNYTLPLHRSGFTKQSVLNNYSQSSGYGKLERTDGIIGRTKHMAANIENVLKKFVDSAPNKDNNKKESKCSQTKHSIIDSDLSNFEQLVIMKKYPFLDLQELNYNYRSSNKNPAQSLHSARNLAQDTSFCESSDEGPNVEITNRGLSGFSLPTKLIRTENESKIKMDTNNAQSVINTQPKTSLSTTPTNNLSLLENLEEEIKLFEKQVFTQ